MKFKIIVSLFLLATISAYSQELKYKSGGRIFNSENKKMSPKEVRELLAKQPGMLQFYNVGRSKKDVGNVMLYGGMALLAGDFILAASKPGEGPYPTLMTVLGAASVIISIPVKAGYTKKIKTVVNDYNAELTNKDTGLNFESMSIVANNNGLGLKLTF